VPASPSEREKEGGREGGREGRGWVRAEKAESGEQADRDAGDMEASPPPV